VARPRLANARCTSTITPASWSADDLVMPHIAANDFRDPIRVDPRRRVLVCHFISSLTISTLAVGCRIGLGASPDVLLHSAPYGMLLARRPCRNLRAKSEAKETVWFQCVISLRQL
jgi:hypothetical protein